MLNQIKQKMLVCLRPSEAVNHIKGDLNIDTHIALNQLLLRLKKRIEAIPDDLHSHDFETAVDSKQALDDMADLIQGARHETAHILKDDNVRKKFDLYLHALQLHLQNYDYYQSIGIDFFTDSSITGIPSLLFHHMGLPFCSTPPSDYLNMVSYEAVSEPEYATPEIIEGISEFFIMYVTASSPNPYGHVLLGTDQGYFHINAAYGKPQYIPKDKLNDYLRDTIHMVLGVQQVYVPDIDAAKAKLLEMNSKPWLWSMRHNCANFSHTILTAGGVSHAHVDPVHIGDYHHTQYPVELLAYANPISLNKKVYDGLSTEEKVGLKNHHEEDVPLKKRFIGIGKCAGLKGKEAKAYAHYRMDDGLSHKKAQYKAKPSFMNFLVKHQSKIRNVALLNPLLFVLASPFLIATHVKSFAFQVNCFFYTPKKPDMEKKTNAHCAISSSKAPPSEKERIRVVS